MVGRNMKSPKLPWSREKTVAGSLAVFLGGWALAILIVAIYSYSGNFDFSAADSLFSIAIIAFGVMLVESLPFKDVDNLTTTLTAVILGGFFF